MAVMDVADTTLYAVVAVVLNLTVVAPVRFFPVIVTTVPTGPEAGEKLVMEGAAAAAGVRTTAYVTPVSVHTACPMIWPAALIPLALVTIILADAGMQSFKSKDEPPE